MTGLWVKGKELSSGVPALPVGLAAVSPASWPALWEGVARAPATVMRAQGPEHRPEAAVSTQLPSMRQNPASSLHVSPWSQGGRIGGCLFIGVETPQAGLTLKPSNPQRTDEQKSWQDSFPPCSAVSVESLAGCASCCPLVRMARPLHGLHSGPQGRLWAGGAPWWVGQGWGEHRHPGVAARTWRGAVTGAGGGGNMWCQDLVTSLLCPPGLISAIYTNPSRRLGDVSARSHGRLATRPHYWQEMSPFLAAEGESFPASSSAPRPRERCAEKEAGGWCRGGTSSPGKLSPQTLTRSLAACSSADKRYLVMFSGNIHSPEDSIALLKLNSPPASSPDRGRTPWSVRPVFEVLPNPEGSCVHL